MKVFMKIKSENTFFIKLWSAAGSMKSLTIIAPIVQFLAANIVPYVAPVLVVWKFTVWGVRMIWRKYELLQ